MSVSFRPARASAIPQMGKPAAPVKRSTRVLIRPDELLPLHTELLLIAALEELKRQHDHLRIEYGTYREALIPLLKGRWFLSQVHGIWSERLFQDSVVRDSPLVTITEPEPEAALAEEERRYSRWHSLQLSRYQQLLGEITRLNMRDTRPEPPPAYQFRPSWHQSQALLWQLGEELGLDVDIPAAAIAPFHDFPGKVLQNLRGELTQRGYFNKPFLIYDLECEGEPIALVSTLSQAWPNVRLLSLHQVRQLCVELERPTETSDGLDPAVLHLLLSDPNCVTALGPVGPLTYLAGTVAGLPVVQLYLGSNPQWDGAMSPTTFLLDRNRTQAEHLPQLFIQAGELTRNLT